VIKGAIHPIAVKANAGAGDIEPLDEIVEDCGRPVTMQTMRLRLVPFIAVVLSASLGGCRSEPAVRQISTLQALMRGAYEREIACRDLPRYGTLGIGTFNDLDGELILLDGTVYQARADGSVVCNPRTTTPFANVVSFHPQTLVPHVTDSLNLEQLHALLDRKCGSKNLIYAVRIDGTFTQLKLRSVPKQSPPYPPLTEVVKQQQVHELADVHGTLVGFRFPEYFRDMNLPGWHLHFISDDRRLGGHVLGLTSADLTLQLQTIRRFEMTLPTSGTFATADLDEDLSKDIRQVEH
jgi:acetolactate decarboxylase